MQSAAKTPQEYIRSLDPEIRSVIEKLRKELKDHLPKGFSEEISYGMLGYVVPHRLFPEGYHVNPELPLPLINLASQKNFTDCKTKPDMRKSCARVQTFDDIPLALIGELAAKISPEKWIEIYRFNLEK